MYKNELTIPDILNSDDMIQELKSYNFSQLSKLYFILDNLALIRKILNIL